MPGSSSALPKYWLIWSIQQIYYVDCCHYPHFRDEDIEAQKAQKLIWSHMAKSIILTINSNSYCFFNTYHVLDLCQAFYNFFLKKLMLKL